MNPNSPMTAKEYLEQALRLEYRIRAKLAQIGSLRCLSERVTSFLSDMPRSQPGNPHTLENTVVRIVEMEHEVDAIIDRMLAMQHEIADMLEYVPDGEHQELLASRYIRYSSWKEIAEAMHYNERYIYKLHDRALKAFDAILPAEKRTRGTQESVR